MQFDDQFASGLVGQPSEGRHQLTVDLFPSTAGTFVRFGEEDDLRLRFRSSLYRHCGDLISRCTECNFVVRNMAYALQVVMLHFAFGKVEIRRQVFNQKAAIERAMMKVECRQTAFSRQQNWKSCVGIAVIAAKHAGDWLAFKYGSPGVAHCQTLAEDLRKFIQPA